MGIPLHRRSVTAMPRSIFYDDFTTLNPTVWSADSGSWNAVSFDGATCAVIEPAVDNNYLRAITSDFSGTQGWIIESRIYTTPAGDTTAHPGISFYGRSGNNDHLYFRPHSDAIGVQKAYYDGTVHVQTALAGKFPWNTWNHVSVKLTGDTVQPALNGVSLGSFTSTVSTIPPMTKSVLQLIPGEEIIMTGS